MTYKCLLHEVKDAQFETFAQSACFVAKRAPVFRGR
jgi:hypothetical protein